MYFTRYNPIDSSGRTAKTVVEDERDFAAVMRDYVNSMAGSAMAPWDIRSPTRKIYEQDYRKRKEEERQRMALVDKFEKAKKQVQSKAMEGMSSGEKAKYREKLKVQEAAEELSLYLERKEKIAGMKRGLRSNALYPEAEDPFAALIRMEGDRQEGRGLMPGRDATYAAEFYRKKRQDMRNHPGYRGTLDIS